MKLFVRYPWSKTLRRSCWGWRCMVQYKLFGFSPRHWRTITTHYNPKPKGAQVRSACVSYAVALLQSCTHASTVLASFSSLLWFSPHAHQSVKCRQTGKVTYPECSLDSTLQFLIHYQENVWPTTRCIIIPLRSRLTISDLHHLNPKSRNEPINKRKFQLLIYSIPYSTVARLNLIVNSAKICKIFDKFDTTNFLILFVICIWTLWFKILQVVGWIEDGVVECR